MLSTLYCAPGFAAVTVCAPSSTANIDPLAPCPDAALAADVTDANEAAGISRCGPEFNARFGDHEWRVLLRQLESHLGPALSAADEGPLVQSDPRSYDHAPIAVVLAVRGYSEASECGGENRRLDAATALPGRQVFHAGTTHEAVGCLVAAGRGVLNVCVIGADLSAVRARAAIEWAKGLCHQNVVARAAAA